MAEGEAIGRRPRRAAAKNSAVGGGNQPSAMHYVGYVEEDETPEQIMAKFEQLEKIQREVAEAKKAAQDDAAGGEDGEDASPGAEPTTNPEDEDLEEFDQALLEKVFARTSKFSLKRALADDLYGDDEDQFFDEDDDEVVDVENIFGGWGKKKRRLKGAPREPRAPRAQAAEVAHDHRVQLR